MEEVLSLCSTRQTLQSQEDSPPLPIPPIQDDNLVPSLALRAVVLLPSLHHDIARVSHRELKKCEAENVEIPPADDEHDFPIVSPEHVNPDAKSADDIGWNYIRNVGLASQTIASTLVLHPGAQEWDKVLGWNRVHPPQSQKHLALDETFAPFLQFRKELVLKSTLDAIDPKKFEILKEVEKRLPRLAIWQVFAITPEVQRLLEEMGKFSARDHISDSLDGNSHKCPPFDNRVQFFASLLGVGASSRAIAKTINKNVFSPTSMCLRTSSQRPPTRREPIAAIEKSSLKRKRRTQASEPKFEDTTVNFSKSVTPADHNPNATPMTVLRRAWRRAVESDSTFIVLHAGNYERIGIRHRASGTLFLSKLIDVTSREDGPYGALHVGLHICILEDILARFPMYLEAEQAQQTKRTRSAQARVTSTRRTRYKSTLEADDEVCFIDAVREAEKRSCLLLEINYDIFRSGGPLPFIRVGTSYSGRQTFKPTECTMVELTSYIAEGAVGHVHTAKLRILSETGRLLECNAIVKLAYERWGRKRLRREFDIYQHLSASKVIGVPRIFGLFQDMKTRALALVMQDVGRSIVETYNERKTPDGWVFSEQESQGFMNALKSIHAAGVRHRDIRPENLTLTKNGNAYIIDFDKAELDASEKSREEELEYLREWLIDGDYTAPGDVPTEDHPHGWKEPSGPPSPEVPVTGGAKSRLGRRRTNKQQ